MVTYSASNSFSHTSSWSIWSMATPLSVVIGSVLASRSSPRSSQVVSSYLMDVSPADQLLCYS